MKITKLAALGLSGALLLAACGSDDDDDKATDTDKKDESTLRVWLNGPDTPEEMRDFAIAEFNKKYPDVKVEIEQQEWDGLPARLLNVLPTNDTPDIVEIGNTDAQQFESAGALLDLTDLKSDLGGDDLSDSLVEAGTYDDKFYGVPLYGGARVVTYRKDLFEASGIAVPTTMAEFVAAGQKLQADNAATPNFSGIYFPGRNFQAMFSFIWDAGGDIATQDGGDWVGELASDESVAGLTTVQQIMQTANQAPADGDDRNDFQEFCNGEIGMLIGPGWKIGQILGEDGGCPATMEGKLGAFPLPGANGESAPVFLGGSVLGVSAKSGNQEMAIEFLKIISGEEFQTQYAENGLIPARKSLLGAVTGDEAVQAQAKAAENSRFTPNSKNWGEVEAQDVLQDMGTALSEGANVKEEAQRANDAIVEILNS